MTMSDFPRRILLRTCGGIGDLVMHLPFLNAVQKYQPESEVSAVVGDGQRKLVELLTPDLLQGTLYIDGKRKVKRQMQAFFGTRAGQYDLYVRSTSKNNFPLFGLSGAKEEIRLKHHKESPWFKFSHGQIPQSQREHIVDRVVDLMNYLNLPTDDISFDIPFSETDRVTIEKLVQDNELKPGTIAMNANSSSTTKDIPQHLIQEIINQSNYFFQREVVLFGEKTGFQFNGKVIDLRGKTNFTIDSYFLQKTNLFDVIIGPDTGMMHIAGSVNFYKGKYRGNKTISLFGPSNPFMYAPYDPTGQFNIVVAAQHIDYETFSAQGFAPDKHTRPYMSQIKLEQVVRAIETQLSK